jgi:hypothetical protein
MVGSKSDAAHRSSCHDQTRDLQLAYVVVQRRALNLQRRAELADAYAFGTRLHLPSASLSSDTCDLASDSALPEQRASVQRGR